MLHILDFGDKDSVFRVLSLRKPFPVKKLRLVLHHYVDRSHVRKWLDYAVEHGVQELHLLVKRNSTCELPHSLFNCGSLEVLELNGKIVLDCPSSVHLPNLKHLYLKKIKYANDDSFHRLLIGSPNLLRLHLLNRPYNNVNFILNNPTLEYLDIDNQVQDARFGHRKSRCKIKEVPVKPIEATTLELHEIWQLWQIHNAEQMILDDLEANPEKYKGKKLSELTDDEDFDEENSVIHTKAYYKKALLPKVILKTSVKELDLEPAFAERQHHNKLKREAEERGEKYKIDKLRRNIEMDEHDLLHWRRSFEEREALIRDISCRQALGLPLEEPGRYKDASFFGRDKYDPSNPLYRYDYWGEPKNSEESKQERMTDAHNKSIVVNGVVCYEMSYNDCIKQKMKREAEEQAQKQADHEDSKRDHDEDEDKDDDEDDDDDDEDDYDLFSILRNIMLMIQTNPMLMGLNLPECQMRTDYCVRSMIEHRY
ncbi:hypothetical protein SO802_005656 [Lithocarpus litseifolius]|uniref:F-box/LRR-repeat protein 15/At3g58940/PEG3-like LRR domain-containing protein n=1 Tax=Lithocarpus litseifolius TaxID=425828 RepID=A0AAW2DIS7_9ROSI